MTPTDAYAFVGDPPLMRPEADEVHISVTFTWDIKRACELYLAWRQYYKVVRIGGPAFRTLIQGFSPGLYIKKGITFTSRGCNNSCPWCLVPQIEGRLKLLDILPGWNIQDNNILQTGKSHLKRVFAMLKKQNKAITFGGGLQSDLVNDWVAGNLADLPIDQLFLSADTWAALRPLEMAIRKLPFLNRRQLRCYVLLGFDKTESIEKARQRLEHVWEIGCLPFAQLYQPPDQYIEYSKEWKQLARTWSRPAAMFSEMSE